jgi:PAS domain S-box-containing protein
MKNPNSKPDDAAILRQKAEKQLKLLKSARPSVTTDAQKLKLIHELEVHQIELEMQNEELLAAKEKAEQAEEKYTDLYNFAPSGYLSLTKVGEILHLNFAAARMLGKERSKLINYQFSLFLSKNTRPTFNQFLEKTFANKEKQTCEVIIETKNNSELEENYSPIYVTIESIANKDGKLCHLIVFDITSRLQAEEKLHQKNEELIIAKQKAEENDKLKSAFLANMSHEIRTPMNGLIGFSERLKKDNLSDEQKNRYIDIIQNSAKSLLTLINDIIDISKIEAGQLTIIKEPCLPGKLLHEISDTFNEIKIQRNKSHIQIVKKIPQAQEFVEFITDSNRLKQVLINLIGNALKFSDKGTIEFGYEIVNKRIRFFVKDDGIGIAPKDLDNIFNRFQQASISDDRVYEGTGLGLSISKGIIELLGGEIKVASTLGKGSTFEFFLPYKQLDKKQNIDVEEKGVNFDKFNGKSILIAEDDLISQDLYQETFKEFPAKMLYAYNGKEAVDIIAEKPDIDLILMDIRMPIMDGIEATKRILKQNPKIKIIAQTAHAMTNDKHRFLEMGFVDHLPKPIDMDELIVKISKWL